LGFISILVRHAYFSNILVAHRMVRFETFPAQNSKGHERERPPCPLGGKCLNVKSPQRAFLEGVRPFMTVSKYRSPRCILVLLVILLASASNYTCANSNEGTPLPTTENQWRSPGN